MDNLEEANLRIKELERELEVRDMEQIGMGQLIEELKKFDYSSKVKTKDDQGVTGYDSYRGNYCEMALSYSHIKEEWLNVGQLIEALDLARYSYMTGYKGGEYKITDDTCMNLSNYGNWSQLEIVGVETNDADECVVLTKKEAGW